MRRLLVGSAVAAALIVSATASRRAADVDQAAGSAQVSGTPITPVSRVVVNFADLALIDQQRQNAAGPNQPPIGSFKEEAEYEEPEVPLDPAATAQAPRDFVPGPSVPSPSPALSFIGVDDIPLVGTGTSVIPPDTQGVVGLDRVFTTLNNNYRVHNKATGAVISTVSIATFWSSVPDVSGVFDPKIVYDPYNNRFLAAAVANAQSPTSQILFGISSTSDPGGTWTLYGFAACVAGAPCDDAVNGGNGVTDWWADYPELGFNKNWAAVSVNMFTTAFGIFQQSRLITIDYPLLLTGAPAEATLFFGIPDFTVVPAATYSSSETTLYAPSHFSSGGRSYRLNRITGTAADPIYTQGALTVHSLVSAWVQPGGDVLPQAPEPVTDLVHGIDSGDARILNAVFRNNAIWYAQTIGLPAAVVGPLTHTAAQWVKLNTSGIALDAGRVEDPTATSNNGGKWYAYPSISVNAADDVLFGFSEFSSSSFASAGYTFRFSADAAGSMREVVIAKAGEGFYYKTYGGERNRWGDYSATQVDPSNDQSLWTIQQYSNPQVGTGNGSGRWSTWWVKVPTHYHPTISAIQGQSTLPGTATGAIPFTVGDAETPAASLIVTGNSSNTAVVPNGNIVFGGSGASRTVTVTPTNQTGTATITVTVSDGVLSAQTPFLLTVTSFTDDPLTSATTIKAVHVTELRTRIDAIRGARGLKPYTWTDATLSPGSTVVRAVHVVDLRAALAEAYVAAMLSPPTYTDPSLAAGTAIKAVHIAEIRAAVVAIE